MDFASYILGNEITEAIGWFIIHSLWQGALIAGLLFITLALLRRWSSQIRYYLSFGSLLMMVVFSAITFHKALTYADEKIELRQVIMSNPDYLANYLKENRLNEEENSILPAKKLFNKKRALRRVKIQKHFPWIVSIWIIGLVIYLVRVVAELLYLRRIRRNQGSQPDMKWIMKAREFAKRLQIKKKVGIYLSTIIKSPLTTGFLKPVILIPASLLTGLSHEHIEAIIAHELAHIKRNDYLINILQTLIETLFFFHPAVWYISAQIRKERENACDDIAIALTNDKVNYAKALTLAQEHIHYHAKLAMAFSPFRSSLFQRIKRLNTKIKMKTNLTEKLIAGVIVLSGFVFLSFVVDGKYNQFKQLTDSRGKTVDSTSGPNTIVVHKTNMDSSGHEVLTKHNGKERGEELDSLIAALEEHGEMSKEVEKVFELALAEKDEILSEEIMQSIHLALTEIDIDEIFHAAMEAIKEAGIATQVALEDEEIHLKICESLDGEFPDSVNIQTQLVVKEALDAACKELEELDINVVIADALKEAGRALEELDLENVINEAFDEAMEECDEEMEEFEKERRYVVKIRKDFDDEEINFEEQEQVLEEKKEELKRQLKELEEQKKEVRKKQKVKYKNKKE